MGKKKTRPNGISARIVKKRSEANGRQKVLRRVDFGIEQGGTPSLAVGPCHLVLGCRSFLFLFSSFFFLLRSTEHMFFCICGAFGAGTGFGVRPCPRFLEAVSVYLSLFVAGTPSLALGPCHRFVSEVSCFVSLPLFPIGQAYVFVFGALGAGTGLGVRPCPRFLEVDSVYFCLFVAGTPSLALGPCHWFVAEVSCYVSLLVFPHLRPNKRMCLYLAFGAGKVFC